MIDSGREMAHHQKWKHPLMYAWHDKHYLGAAHGLAGIFYILMLVIVLFYNQFDVKNMT